MTPRLRRSVLLSLPGTTVPGIAAYVAFVAIERFDGAETLGYLSLAWVVSNIGSAIVAMGPSNTALRLIAADPARAESVRARFRSLVLVRSVVLGLAVAAGGLAVHPWSPDLGMVLLLAAPWLVGQAFVLFEAETLKAAHRFAAASAVLTVRAVVGWAASVAGAAAFGGLAAAVLPTAIVGLVVAVALAGTRVERVTDDDREAARTIGRPVGVLAVASYALGYGDRFVVQAFLGPVAVATYTLGYQLGEGAMELVTAPVTAAALPKVVGTWQQGGTGPAEAWALSRRIGAGILALAVAAPVVVLVARPTGVFHLISDDGRLPAVAAITAAAVGLQGLTRIGYGLLLAQGRTRTALTNFLLVGALSLVVAPLLTWRYGLVGAAWATLVGYGSLAALTTWTVRAHPEAVVVA